MTQILADVEQQCLQFNSATIKEAYNHITKLANGKFKEPIKVLQARHHGYEKDDFIQETMQIILTESTKKTFPTINHLKSFINLTMQYHYLKEKRKYFFTKQRGEFKEISIFDTVSPIDGGQTKLIAETLTYDKEESLHLSEELDLKALTKRQLYIVYDWKHLLEVCELSELKNYKTGYALSVNYLIKALTSLGAREACKHFKEIGFFMTRKILDDISQKLIQYINDNHIIEVTIEKSQNKVPTRTREDRFKLIEDCKRTCTCGFHYDEELENTHWQCPICGKMHDPIELVKHRSGLLSSLTKV